MFANYLRVLLFICGYLTIIVTCGSFNYVKYDRIKLGARASEESISKKLEEKSLIECSVLCQRNPNCNAFQFTKSVEKVMIKGSCDLLVYAENPESFDSTLIIDTSCNIYRVATHEENTLTTIASTTEPTTEKSTLATTSTTPPTTTETTTPTTTVTTSTTTATTSTTTATTPTTTVVEETTVPSDPNCDYAGAPVSFSCNCSVSSSSCTGILQCSAKYSDKLVLYYLDRTKASSTYDSATSSCTSMSLKLFTIKTKEEQSTICNILVRNVGTSVAEAFWMALENESGNGKYTYPDGDTLDDALDVWSATSPHGYVYLDGSGEYYKWGASKKGDGKEIKSETGRAICSKIIT